MTDHVAAAGSGHVLGPAREQVVIKDKRKIDESGRAKGSNSTGDGSEKAGAEKIGTEKAGSDKAGSDKAGSDKATTNNNKPEATMGQPGSPGVSSNASPHAGADTATDTATGTVAGDVDGASDPAAGQAGTGQAGAGDGAGGAGAAGAGAGGVGVGEAPAEPGPGSLGAELEALRSELDERLRDLQRVTAEYANYRKRVERDRGVAAEQVMAMVVASLLPILDDVDRARDHGDLVGPFSAVAEQLTAALTKLGLTAFGEPGDAFDPNRHEAVAHQTSAEVSQPTCVEVMRRGYLLGERLLRAAMVAVADPE